MPTFECPICRKSITVSNKEEAPFRPFCSNRCKMVDLGRWMDGTYTISESSLPGDIDDPIDSKEDHD